MTIDRRLIIGSILSGGLLSATPALALVSDRYNTLVQLQEDLSLVTTNARSLMEEAGIVGRPNRAAFLEATGLYRHAEALFNYLALEFNGSDLNKPGLFETVRQLFDKTLVIDTLDENQLREVEDAVVVIAVSKHVLVGMKCPVNVDKTPSFETIAKRYRHLILG